MNFFETSDEKVIFDIDKIKMIISNDNQLFVYLDGIKQYYVLTGDDSIKIKEKLKDKIVPIEYCKAEDCYIISTDDQNIFYWPNENTIMHPESVWGLVIGGANHPLNTNGPLKKLSVKVILNENNIEINLTYDDDSTETINDIKIQEATYNIYCSNPPSEKTLIQINSN